MNNYFNPAIIRQIILCLLLSALNMPALSLFAADPPRVAFHGVVVGETTETELLSNKQWGQGQLVKTAPGRSIHKVLEYKLGIWKKVRVTISENQIVQTIDVTPPDRARADDLVKVLKLGKLIPIDSIKSLPPDALTGLTIYDDWQVFHCDNASGVLIFTEKVDQKLYAKRMRFYLTPLEHAKQHIAKGQTYMKQEEYGKAVSHFSESIRLNPNNLHAYTLRGMAHTELIKKHEDNFNKINKLLESEPENPNLYNRRGVVYSKLGEYDNAAQDFTTAIRLAPKEAKGYFNRAYMMFHKQEYDKAIVDFDKAIQLDPQYASSYYGRGYAYFRKGQFKAAEEDRSRAIQLDSKIARLTYKSTIID